MDGTKTSRLRGCSRKEDQGSIKFFEEFKQRDAGYSQELLASDNAVVRLNSRELF